MAEQSQGSAVGLRPNISLGVHPKSVTSSTGRSPRVGFLQETLQKLKTDGDRGSTWCERTLSRPSSAIARPSHSQSRVRQGIQSADEFSRIYQDIQAGDTCSNNEGAEKNLITDDSLHDLNQGVVADCSPDQYEMTAWQPRHDASQRPYSACTTQTPGPRSEISTPLRPNSACSTIGRKGNLRSDQLQSAVPPKTPAHPLVALDDVSVFAQKFLSEANDARCLWAETQRVREQAEELLRLNGHAQMSSFFEELRSAKEDMGRLGEHLRGLTTQLGGFSIEALQEVKEEMKHSSRVTSQLSMDSGRLQQSLQEISSVVLPSFMEEQKKHQQSVADELHEVVHSVIQSFQASQQDAFEVQLEKIANTLLSPLLEPLHAELQKLRQLNVCDAFNLREIRAKAADAERAEMQKKLDDVHQWLMILKEAQTSSVAAHSEKLDQLSERLATLPEEVALDPKLNSKLEESSLAVERQLQESNVAVSVERLVQWTSHADDEFKRSSKQLTDARSHRNELMSVVTGTLEKGKQDRVHQLEKMANQLEKDLENAGTNLLRSLAQIESKGNVEINTRSGDVKILKDIAFVGKKPPQHPTAEFAADKDAHSVLDDVAAIWNHFQVPMRIEGHTKGGESEFWQELADNRAQLIVEALHKKGVVYEKMTAAGLPGKKGLNKVGVVVQLDIFPDMD